MYLFRKAICSALKDSAPSSYLPLEVSYSKRVKVINYLTRKPLHASASELPKDWR